MELVAKPEMIVIHVSDHGKPMKLTTVPPARSRCSTATTRPKHRWQSWRATSSEAKGSFKVGAGTKVLAEVALNGKHAVSARSHSSDM